jgi:hypothetical protein
MRQRPLVVVISRHLRAQTRITGAGSERNDLDQLDTADGELTE